MKWTDKAKEVGRGADAVPYSTRASDAAYGTTTPWHPIAHQMSRPNIAFDLKNHHCGG